MIMGHGSKPSILFCQTILHRFPIEAGITPHARLADDDEQARLKRQARNNIMGASDSALMRAVRLIAEMADEGRADQILQAFLNQETRLADPQILDKVIAHFEMDLEIPNAKARKRKHAAIASIDMGFARGGGV